MGWSLFIGIVFTLALIIGLLIGLIHPTYTAFFSDEAIKNKVPIEAKSPLVLAMASITSSFRFGAFSIIALIALAFLCGICFTIFAILRSTFT